MSTLAEMRDRVEAVLMDAANAIWDADTVDEAIRQVLDEYNQVCPLSVETMITLPGGRSRGGAEFVERIDRGDGSLVAVQLGCGQ